MGASTQSRAPGRRPTAAGSLRNGSSRPPPSWPTWTRWPPSTVSSRARPRSRSVSPDSPLRASGAPRSSGCAASAASTRSPRSRSAWRSATSAVSSVRASLPRGLASYPRSTSRAKAKRAARSPRPARATPAACWSRRPGSTYASRESASRSATANRANPAHVLQIAWRAQHRLHRLHQRMRGRGKPGNVIVVAAARELACFLWAAAMAP
jgi:hypothetical protein